MAIRRSDDVDTFANMAAFVEAWTLMTAAFPERTIAREQGVSVMFANTVCAMLNGSLLDRPITDEDGFSAAIDVAKHYISRCPHPSMVGICGEWAPENWEAKAAAKGLAPAMQVIGMSAAHLAPLRRPKAKLEWRLADDIQTGIDLGLVNARAYGMPAEQFEPTGNIALWQGAGCAVVGYEKGEPVSCAAAFVGEAMIYIGFVATLPDKQGQGYGEAAMRRAIAAAEGKAGPKRLWLHATEIGLPLYAHMGFESVSPIHMMAPV